MTDHPLKHDAKAAVDFLEQFHPHALWSISVFKTHQKGHQTREFDSQDRDRAESFIQNHNDWNCYFAINPPPEKIGKKTEKVDIRQVGWLQVDIDPRPGEPIEEERRRALALLTSALPDGVPKPTVVMDSGGGYWGLWKLAVPQVSDGSESDIESIESINRALARTFGGDSCHNIDRIARLPGTINHPTPSKAKKGRVVTKSSLISFDESLIYDLADFSDLEVPTVKLPTGPLNLKPVEAETAGSIDDLDEWCVDDRFKIIAVQGRCPDEGPKTDDDSRSAWLFDFVCGLVRANVPDEKIKYFITSADFDISASVLDKGRNSGSYADRQIARAHQAVESPELVEMNDRFAVVENEGGKCLVFEEVYEEVLGRDSVEMQVFTEFKKRFQHRTIEVAGKPRRLGDWWLSHPHRRQYPKIVFDPGNTYASENYSLWRGFAVKPGNGDCQLFLDYIRENLCNGNDEHYDYFLSWMANVVQNPGEPGQVAIVLKGGQGTGKSFFADQFGRLFGQHYVRVSDPRHFVGNFNHHLRDCVLLFADEAFYAGDKAHESQLKSLITEPFLMFERKFHDPVRGKNCVHLIMASNKDWVIPAGEDERRYLVLKVGDRRKQDSAYFSAINKQMNDGGREALLNLLLERDISDFNVRTAPKTEELDGQKRRSMAPLDRGLRYLLNQGILPSGFPRPDAAPTNGREGDEKSGLLGFFRLHEPRLKHEGTSVVTDFLKDRGCKNYQYRGQRGWRFPPLDEMREAFEARFGPQTWDNPELKEWQSHYDEPEIIPF